MMKPTSRQLERGLLDLAHEFVSCLSAGKEMLDRHGAHPIDYLVQDAFLVHYRALREFFRGGDPKRGRERSEKKNNVWAVDYVDLVKWDSAPFEGGCGIEVAINKYLSHLTYSRDPRLPESGIEVRWSGSSHLVGAVRALLLAWDEFIPHVRREFKDEFERRLADEQTKYLLKIEEFRQTYESRARDQGFSTDDLPGNFLRPTEPRQQQSRGGISPPRSGL